MILVRYVLGLVCATLLIFAGASGQTSEEFRPFSEMHWRSVGPFRAGRTIAVTGVIGHPHLYFTGTAAGGAWKTTDDGHTWLPIFDGQSTGSIGSIAVAPSNPSILYMGTGEGLQRKDVSFGDGVYKSTDGGKTWTPVGLKDSQQIGTILVDPKDPDRVFVAVLGHPFGPSQERGVYRTRNGGQTWEKVLYKDENTGAIALIFDPGNPNTIFADLWAWRLGPWPVSQNCFGDQSCGLYKSTDGGNTWSFVTGLPTSADRVGRIGLGIAGTDPKRLYALVDAGPKTGLYRSEDGGQSWEVVNKEKRVSGRGWDFAAIAVDPKNENVLWVGNQSLLRSMDGGRTFIVVKGSLDGDDYHSIWINPDDPSNLIVGSDQGATITVNGGETWTPWYNQPTGQFHHVITDNRFPYWIYGSQQESGTAAIISRSDYGQITFREWHPVGGAEIGYIAPDPLHPNLVYSDSVVRFNHLTGQTQEVGPLRLTGRFASWPLVFSPADPHALYLGMDIILKTVDAGEHWETVSPDLARAHPGAPENLGVFAAADPTHGNKRGAVNTIAPSPLDAGLLWAGTDDGQIQMTRDGGKSWKDVTPSAIGPWSSISLVEASHFEKETAYAAVDRHRLDDFHPYIYRTHDGGNSWQSMAQGLPPSGWVYEVREDPIRKGLLFAATERGIYVSLDDGNSWESLQLNLPRTSVRGLAIHGDDLVAATFGRGFWILDNITPLRQFTSQIVRTHAYLFAPQVVYRLRRQGRDNPLPPEIPMGQNPPDGAIIDYFVGTDSKGPLTLEILDEAQNTIRRFSSTDPVIEPDPSSLFFAYYWTRPPAALAAKPGMHRFVWDLRYPSPEAIQPRYSMTEIPHDTPLRSYGPFVLPGHYFVRLVAGNTVQLQPLTVKLDPRIETPPAGLKAQFDLLQSMCYALARSHQALDEIEVLKTKLSALEGRPGDDIITSALDSVRTQLTKSAGAFRQLNSILGQLLELADSADAAPTADLTANIHKLLKEIFVPNDKEWTEFQDQKLPSANAQLRKAGLPELTLDKK
jgi:photosystem II stability/assembly factor-like uncharacterized protein